MMALHTQGWALHVLGWTLLHFCWQGAAVAGLLWCVLALLGGRGAAMRYGAACCALGLMVAAPVVTFWELAVEARGAGGAGAVPAINWVITVVPGGTAGGHWMERLAGLLDGATPWVPWVWLAGVTVFLVRLQFGLGYARRMKTEDTVGVEGELAARFAVLAERLGVRQVVRLVQSARVEAPTVIGWLRPVVLMPVGCLARLSTAQVEALLVHELAHIRRGDYLVNVLQSVVEALLFYHPAVWWVSKQVRLERECCCDRMAAEVGGDALGYAKALSFLETRRAFLQEVALGANGGVLTMRIKRLLGYRERSVASQGAAFALLAAVVLVPGGYVATMAHAQQAKLVPAVLVRSQADVVQAQVAQAEEQGLRGPYKMWLDQDVLWIIAPEERKAFLRLTTDEERDHFIAQFWDRRNPKPGSGDDSFRVEHYRRIAYANEHFGGEKAGWRSDRGHAYIAYGRPESVDSHPADAVPYEVWHYRALKGVEGEVDLRFVDPCQCGEFKLAAQSGTAISGVKPGGGTVKAVSYTPAAVQEGPVRVSAGVMAGQLVSRGFPVYPEEAKADGVQGSVVLKAVISKEGTVTNLQVESGPEQLRASAIDAVRQWVYKPYLLNGNPTEVDTSITVNYHLGDVSAGASRWAGAASSASASSSAAGTSSSPGASSSTSSSNWSGTPWTTDSGRSGVPAGVMAGQLVSRPDPVYPPEAKEKRIQGAVVLKALISKDGTIKNLQVLSGPDELTGSAIDAVRQWTYKPYLLNGQPTEVETTITVNYTFGGGMSSVPKRIGNGVSAPVPVSMPDPNYSEEARKEKVSGVVQVNFWVDEQGNTTHVRVVRGIGHGLDEKAIETVKRYKFKPGMEDGRPVTVAMNVAVDFKVF